MTAPEYETGETRQLIVNATWKACAHGGGWWIAQDADGRDVLLSVDLAVVQPAQVRVKPLVWSKLGYSHIGTGHFGTRFIISERESGFHVSTGMAGVTLKSLPAAKAFYDREYIGYVSAALEPQPDPRDEVIKGLVEAGSDIAREMAFMLRHNPYKDGGMYRDALDSMEAALAAAKAVQHD